MSILTTRNCWIWHCFCWVMVALDLLVFQAAWWVTTVWAVNVVLSLSLVSRSYEIQRVWAEARGEEPDHTGIYLGWIENWSQFWDVLRGEPHNWYSFTLLRAVFGDERIFGSYELSLVLLGLGFRLVWHYEDTEEVLEVRRRVDEAKEDYSRRGDTETDDEGEEAPSGDR